MILTLGIRQSLEFHSTANCDPYVEGNITSRRNRLRPKSTYCHKRTKLTKITYTTTPQPYCVVHGDCANARWQNAVHPTWSTVFGGNTGNRTPPPPPPRAS